VLDASHHTNEPSFSTPSVTPHFIDTPGWILHGAIMRYPVYVESRET
jgi:hypothetical protein